MIKNIIFDLCGPIISIDVNLISEYFKYASVKVENPYKLLCDSGLTKKFERGEISFGIFCKEVRHHLNNKNLSQGAIVNAWNNLIVDFPESHISLLKQVHNNYKTFILSNSDMVNAVYFHHFLNTSADDMFCEKYFNEVVFSHTISHRKPEKEAFDYIFSRHGIIP